MEVTVRVDHERRAALLLSLVPFVIEEDKHIDVSIEASVIAKILLMDALIITFYHIICFLARQIASSKKWRRYIFVYLLSSYHVIDKYNDKFMLLVRGPITVEQFLKKV